MKYKNLIIAICASVILSIIAIIVYMVLSQGQGGIIILGGLIGINLTIWIIYLIQSKLSRVNFYPKSLNSAFNLYKGLSKCILAFFILSTIGGTCGLLYVFQTIFWDFDMSGILGGILSSFVSLILYLIGVLIYGLMAFSYNHVVNVERIRYRIFENDALNKSKNDNYLSNLKELLDKGIIDEETYLSKVDRYNERD